MNNPTPKSIIQLLSETILFHSVFSITILPTPSNPNNLKSYMWSLNHHLLSNEWSWSAQWLLYRKRMILLGAGTSEMRVVSVLMMLELPQLRYYSEWKKSRITGYFVSDVVQFLSTSDWMIAKVSSAALFHFGIINSHKWTVLLRITWEYSYLFVCAIIHHTLMREREYHPLLPDWLLT